MRTINFLLVLFITSFVNAQNLSCSDFKMGTFKIECTNVKAPVFTVIRTEKIQKESSIEFNMELEGSIEWISECKYELIYTKSHSAEFLGEKIIAEIIKIEGRKAICKATGEILNDFVMEFIMEKIN